MNNPEQELSPLEREEFQRVHHRVNNICKAAFDAKTPIFIDAEESWIQNSIDRIATAMMNVYNKEWACVYNTIQMYRHDRYQFLVDSLDDATKNNYLLGVKFVRGAYMEKERNRAIQMNYKSPIQPNKEASDMDYNKAIEFSIAHVDRISICNATHNEKSSLLLIELMEKHNIKKNDKRIYFAQLLGMSDNISYNLAYHGFNVAKYVPYGPVVDVLPYLFRRAEENTSVKGQTGRELSLIQTEIRRRKKS
jgi:proline dehydrogenase